MTSMNLKKYLKIGSKLFKIKLIFFRFNPPLLLFEENLQNKNFNDCINKTIFNAFSSNQAAHRINIDSSSLFNNSIGRTCINYCGNEINRNQKDEFNFNKYYLNSSKIVAQNTLINILNSIVMSVMFFCRLMLLDIIKYANINEAYFLDSLIKYVNIFNIYF